LAPITRGFFFPPLEMSVAAKKHPAYTPVGAFFVTFLANYFREFVY
jgi:hypothetical protein